MLLQHQLHLARVDVEAARDDQLLEPAADGERAVLANLPHVGGLEKAVRGERFLGRIRISPVALEDLAALELHLVLLAQPHLDAGKRQSHAAGLARAIVRIRDHDAALGNAVALDRLLAQQTLAALEHCRWQRRRAGDEYAHVGEVGRMLVEPVTEPLVHRRHPEEHRPALIVLSRQLCDDRGG